ncbi:MAG: PhoH family protein [Betaproteobacteria bacterium]|nr:MAG: PhoH family protein [Betaproteobacteria bacterium]
MGAPVSLSLEPIDNNTLATVCGALDANVRRLESEFNVKIRRRGAKFSIETTPAATPASAGATKKALERFRYIATSARKDLTDEDLELTIAELKVSIAPKASTVETTLTHAAQFSDSDATLQFDRAQFEALEAAAGSIPLKVKRADLAARTPMQLEYLRNIQQYDITFGIGPAGTGKTYLAVACAVDAFEREQIKRIVLVRPAVEAGERLGFLPGDLIQKVDPYLRPLYDALFDLMGLEKTTKLMERGTIEVAPLAFMRGRTLNGAFIILDEAQNTTPEQMKMFLTRIGFGTKTVVTGDPTQIDLQKNQKSGLFDAQQVLSRVEGIAFTHFTSRDVVRHPLVQKIVNAYERATPKAK